MWKVPHESSNHARTWLAWPWNVHPWNQIPGTSLDSAQEAIDRLVRLIAKREKVSLLAPSFCQEDLRYRFGANDEKPSAIEFVVAEYNDIWVRDTLPTFAISHSGGLVAIDWRFNGWGRRTREYGKDTELSRTVAAIAGAKVVRTGVVAEGGAFAFDGKGLIVATKSVMFDRNRNRMAEPRDVEKALLDVSGCLSICWLPGDRNEFITTGHADSILCFAANNVVLFHWVDDQTSPEFDICDYNLRIFEEWAARNRRKYEIVKLPVPNHRYGELYCSSYVNLAFVNGAIIVPRLGDGFDRADIYAQEKIFAAFGGKLRVEMLDVRAIGMAGGGIHCVTLQEPAIPTT